MPQNDEIHLGANQQEDTDSSNKTEPSRADFIEKISCPYCYGFVPANQPECTSCGKTIDRSHSKSGNPKPYIYMLFVAPLVWFLSVVFMGDSYEMALVVWTVTYGFTGAIFGNLWPRNAWQWGLLLCIPHWLQCLSIGTDIIEKQPIIGVLLIVQPLIAALFGSYLMVAVRRSGNVK